jgi:hypothetical protein
MEANARYLMSDVFSGYRTAVREANKARKFSALLPIKNIYCNAHARRKFKDAHTKIPNDAQAFIDLY